MIVCVLCGNYSETLDHLLHHCNFSNEVLDKFLDGFRFQGTHPNNLHEWMNMWITVIGQPTSLVGLEEGLIFLLEYVDNSH